ETQDAQRFYYNALYAPWPPDQGEARRRARMELIALLGGPGDTSRARSELVPISGDVPEDAPHQVEIAQLFSAASDHRRALAHFERALAHAPQDPAALSGAGLEAFRLGDYSL